MNFTPSAFVLPPVNAEAINTTTERFGITDAMLTSSTVPEAPPAAYAGGTTYALDAEVSTGTAGGVITCWRSLAGSNTGHTPASSPLWWVETGTTYSVWALGTWAEADIVIVEATHSVYERTAVSPGASAASPETAPTLWTRLGTTNRWAMFDMLSSTPTYAVSPLTVVLAPGRISGLAALKVTAGQMDTDMVSGATVIYGPREESLDGTIIESWDDYFFAPFDPQVNVTLLDLPTYTDGVLTVTFTGGDDLAVGKLVVGTYVPVGRTEDAPRVRLKSFSVVERDQFGDVTDITKRKSIPMVSQTLMVEKAGIRAAKAVLDTMRTTPCVVIGLDNDEDAYSELLTFLAICTDSDVTPKSSGLCPINAEFEGV